MNDSTKEQLIKADAELRGAELQCSLAVERVSEELEPALRFCPPAYYKLSHLAAEAIVEAARRYRLAFRAWSDAVYAHKAEEAAEADAH